jgi:hypothetical protein
MGSARRLALLQRDTGKCREMPVAVQAWQPSLAHGPGSLCQLGRRGGLAVS